MRYFKWDTEHGTAYANVDGFMPTYIVGKTKTHIVSIASDSPWLTEIGLREYETAVTVEIL